ncbi:hypothetical protein [Micromonospora sp. NPDC000668]|uniref:hypothetical protein n=1 Tax=Micromonospora sp. NPDC000668 TaxID=3364219 RepID=UPI00369E3E6C
MAEALLRGYSASLHGARTFVTTNGRTTAVQVAVQGGWMIADIDRMTAMSTDLYVLVDVTEGRRDFYVVPGDDLRGGMRDRHYELMASVGGVRPRNRTAGIPRSTRRTWRHGGTGGRCSRTGPARDWGRGLLTRLRDGSASGASVGCAPV